MLTSCKHLHNKRRILIQNLFYTYLLVTSKLVHNVEHRGLRLLHIKSNKTWEIVKTAGDDILICVKRRENVNFHFVLIWRASTHPEVTSTPPGVTTNTPPEVTTNTPLDHTTNIPQTTPFKTTVNMLSYSITASTYEQTSGTKIDTTSYDQGL